MSTVGANGFLVEDYYQVYRPNARRTFVDKNLADHLKDEGVTMQFIARDGFRVTLNTLMKLTFPKNKKAGVTAISGDGGENGGDFNSIFAQLDSTEAVKNYDRLYGEGSSIRSAKKRKASNAQSRKVQSARFNWRGDQGEMRAWHHQHRGSNGHVSRRSSRVVATYGDDKISNVMYVSRIALNKYKRAVSTSVGKYKGGWQKALRYVQKKTGGHIVLPAYAARHSMASGDVRDTLTPDGDGYIEAINLVPYASRLTAMHEETAYLRTETYLRKATKKQREKIIERFNKL